MYGLKNHLHFVGIGGMGMSAIAKILVTQGYKVTGCDQNIDQKSIHDLQKLGCVIEKGHGQKNCLDHSITIMIYSSAIKERTEELVIAKRRGIPVISRGLILNELMRTKYSIAVAGAHGKTTTSALIAHILLHANHNPTVIIGGWMNNIQTNALLGSGKFLVAETDESDRSITKLNSTLALITNIDLEHLDTYRNLNDIQQSFKYFLHQVPFYGKTFICKDDPNSQLFLRIKKPVITYGLDINAHIRATNILLNANESIFEVVEKHTRSRELMIFPLPGKHNIYNALGAIAVSRELEIPFFSIKEALASFTGVERRFSYRGTYRGAILFEDYGHHPEEIKNTLIVARKKAEKKLIVIFQPHRYTRMEKLWKTFLNTFWESEIDELIVTDIYAAHEQSIKNINGKNFVKNLNIKHTAFATNYIPFQNEFTALKKKLDTCVQEGDLILIIGAGNINHLFQKL